MTWFSVHTHSRYSANDALPFVEDMVAKAVELGWPALGLTDHGSVSGNARLYTSARKAGIEPLPGLEMYLTFDRGRAERSNYHLTVFAYSSAGYVNLCRLATASNHHFFYRPRLDFGDLADFAANGYTEGLAVSTGCYFGMVTQTMILKGDMQARQLVAALASWFPRVYVELQNHGIDHDELGTTDASIARMLIRDVADPLGLPYLITNDAHYLTAEDQSLHNALKSLCSWSDDPSEAIFPGSGYWMLSEQEMASHWPADVFNTCSDNLAELVKSACIKIPGLDTFSLKVPDVRPGKDPMVVLTQMASDRLAIRLEKIKASKKGEYLDRLDTELEVIRSAGMAGYFLLVADVTKFMDSRKIWHNARGSASGSLVTYLLGITEVDPIVNLLRFDRFLSTDRTKPPDIDLDIEHARRDEVSAWLERKFTVRKIGTTRTYSIGGDDEDGKGSLLQRYHYTRKRVDPDAPSLTWKEMPDNTKALLRILSERELVSGFGAHPAGHLIAPDEMAVQGLPMSWIASSKKMVTSYDMDDVEAFGFVKLDLLGLRTGTAIRLALASTGISWDEIPDNDKKVWNRLCKGETAGVFQLEGYTMTIGMQAMQPKCLEDLVIAQSLFRPANFASRADRAFLDRRDGKVKPTRRHPDIERATSTTLGVVLFQDQVLELLRGLDYSPDDVTAWLKALKSSNKHSIAARQEVERRLPDALERADDHGWPANDRAWFSQLLSSNADYSFNRAHAVSYAMVAWRTAWLATNHPVDYWAGLLQAYDDHKQVSSYLVSAKENGVRVLPAHVNHSEISYTLDPSGDAIRRGLISINGIGRKIATEIVNHRPYADLGDFADRVSHRIVGGSTELMKGTSPADCNGAVNALYHAGAFKGLDERQPK